MITLDWERGKDWVVYDGRETVSFRKQEVLDGALGMNSRA